MGDTALAQALVPYLAAERLISTPPSAAERKRLAAAVPLVRERLVNLSDSPGLLRFAFADIDPPADLVPNRLDRPQTARLLAHIAAELEALWALSDEQIEARLRVAAEELGAKFGDLMMALRMAITGSRASPPLIGSMRLVGREGCAARLGRAIKELE